MGRTFALNVCKLCPILEPHALCSFSCRQIVSWIDWTALWPVSCSALLGRANSTSKCNNPCKKKGDLEYFTILNTAK